MTTRILYLTTEFPWPSRSGGTARSLSQLRVLASLPEVHEITVCSVSETPVSAATQVALMDAIPKVSVRTPVFHPVHLFDFPGHVPRVLRLRAQGVPYLAGKWSSKVVTRALRAELREGGEQGPDVIYLDHLGMAVYLPLIRRERPQCHVVLEQHNVESEFFKQWFEVKRFGVKRVIGKLEWQRARAFEARAVKAVDSVVAISDADAATFDALAGVQAHVVPQVMPFTRRQGDHVTEPTACYVGSLRWKPNVAALDWLCQEVWPQVLARMPNAQLLITGEGLTTDAAGRVEVPQAWRVPGVETLGFIQELDTVYQRALCMLAPTVGGAGVRIKVLEGMRKGMPLVVTSEAITGLKVEHDRELRIADDAVAYAENLVGLLTDASARARLRAHSYDFLDRFHTLTLAQERMRGALQRA